MHPFASGPSRTSPLNHLDRNGRELHVLAAHERHQPGYENPGKIVQVLMEEISRGQRVRRYLDFYAI